MRLGSLPGIATSRLLKFLGNRDLALSLIVAFAFVLRIHVEADPESNIQSTAGSAYFLEVRAESSAPQKMQLYHLREQNAGYSETDSILLDLEPGESRVYWFPLHDGKYRGLRLKPARGPATVRIYAARLINGNDRSTVLDLPLETWTAVRPSTDITRGNDWIQAAISSETKTPEFDLLPGGMVVELGQSFGLASVSTAVLAQSLVISVSAVLIVFWLFTGRGWLAPLLDRLREALPAELELDRRGVGFLLAVVALFVGFSAAGLHGSSSSILGVYGLAQQPTRPLLGSARGIRVDEWGSHTPVILYQANRPAKFAVEGATGPHQSILLANAPVHHWSAFFRPQFWAFLLLPVPQAFAVYWQFKSLLLLSGTFLVFHLLVKSSGLAILGSLWFYWSAFTQWAFSWPALLPEMIGLSAWAVVLMALVFREQNRRKAVCYAALLVGILLNFALCAYPPFQIPLIYSAVALWIAWLLDAKMDGSSMKRGALQAGLAMGLTAAILGAFFMETRALVDLVGNTVYPGRRSLAGGSISWALLGSGFTNLFMSEGRFPSRFGNICIASSYYWLALIPMVCGVLLYRKFRPTRTFWTLAGVLLFLTAWMTLPISADIGKFFLLNRVPAERVIPAAGLLNVAIVLTFLGGIGQATMPVSPAMFSTVLILAAAASYGLIEAVNRSTLYFLGAAEATCCFVLLTFVSVSLVMGRVRMFAAGILVPTTWAFLFVNPIGRGLDIYENTDFERLVRDKNLTAGLWIVFSKEPVVAPFLSSMGLNTFNGFQYAPFLDRWRAFDRQGGLDAFYNGSGAALAHCLPAGSQPRMEPLPGLPVMPPLLRNFYVDASDDRLKQAGVRYVAYHGPPNAECFPETGFELLTARPLNGLTVYRYK